MNTFQDFELNEKLLKTLEEIGYKEPTSVQKQAIPQVLKGHDLMVSAQTGTGKTAAFLLPAIHQMTQDHTLRGKNAPRLLVLVPTRELAMQVAGEAEKFTKNHPFIKTVCIYGGVPYPIQKRDLSRPYDILVATPGRLIDHLDSGRISLAHIKMLVLDEADRMLDMGFVEDVERISESIPQERQTLLFSATMDKKILYIAGKLLRNPVEIKVAQDFATKDNIEQRLYFVDNLQHKKQLLEHLLENTVMEQAIVFTATKSAADTLADELNEKGFHCESLHGDMSQRERTRTINKLRKGSISILVATDVAARGIDIATVSLVFNFDMPYQAEDFVHRIGRTGRAGAKGLAISFASFKEKILLTKISKLMGKEMIPLTIAGMEPKTKDNFKGGGGGGGNRGRGGFSNNRGGENRFNSSRRFNNSDRRGSGGGGSEFKPRSKGPGKPAYSNN